MSTKKNRFVDPLNHTMKDKLNSIFLILIHTFLPIYTYAKQLWRQQMTSECCITTKIYCTNNKKSKKKNSDKQHYLFRRTPYRFTHSTFFVINQKHLTEGDTSRALQHCVMMYTEQKINKFILFVYPYVYLPCI